MSGKYYVHFIDDDPVLTYGPYSFKKARDFARIGSQHGGRRMVTRTAEGRVIRVYEKGKRIYPSNRRETKGLLPIEVPPALKK